MKHKLLHGLFALGGVTAGFLIREAWFVTWKNEVTPAEVANFFANIALVMVVPYVVTRSVDQHRRRSQAVNVFLDRVIDAAGKIEDAFGGASAEKPLSRLDCDEIVRRFKVCGRELAFAEKAATHWKREDVRVQFGIAASELTAFKRKVTANIPKDAYVPTPVESTEASSAYFEFLHTVVNIQDKLSDA